jgi:hypothetical protein
VELDPAGGLLDRLGVDGDLLHGASTEQESRQAPLFGRMGSANA